MTGLLLAAAMTVAPVPTAPVITSHFECDMRPGDWIAGGDQAVPSADDRRLLPAQWRLEIAVPTEHGNRVRYDDIVLGAPIEARAVWGVRRGDFTGSGELIHSEYDWWSVEYSLVFTEAGEAIIWNRYLRTAMRDGRPRSIELNGHGACHEIVSFPRRNSS